MPAENDALRDHVVYLLNGGGAHLNFEQAFGDLPEHLRNVKPPGLTYTPWRLLEDLRICQWDILDFCTNPEYKELDWPAEYWHKGDGPQEGESWEQSMEEFRAAHA